MSTNSTTNTVLLLESTRTSDRYDHRVDTLMIDRPGRLRQFYVISREEGQPVGDGLVLAQSTALGTVVRAASAAIKAGKEDYYAPNRLAVLMTLAEIGDFS